MPTPDTTASIDRPWQSLSASAEHVGCSVRHIRRLIDSGRLPAYRVGRLVRIHIEDLDALVRAEPV